MPMSKFAETILQQKYSHAKKDGTLESWDNIAYRVAKHVMKSVDADKSLVKEIEQIIKDKKFIPGGRYLYSSGRPFHQVQNCLLLSVEDSREGWADLMQKATLALMTGAGIGVVYSNLRAKGKLIRRSGGQSTGPISLMQMVNEAGRGIMQGGSRRSAIWAGLHWNHPDIHDFITIKNWSEEVRALKEKDFSFPAALDGTNVSVILDDDFFEAFHDEKNEQHAMAHSVYWKTVKQMLKTAEPGFSVDTGENRNENLRNACTEVTSKDDSDICNLGSINLSRITSTEDMARVVELSTIFLLAGTVYSDVPYSRVDQIRTKNRRLGLGLMGIHEFLLLKQKKYEICPELEEYLKIYAKSTAIAAKYAKDWGLSKPVKTRAIAPTGSIGIIAETTTGIEPIFCLVPGTKVLNDALNWVNIETLQKGDKVIGFREIPLDFRTNKFKFATVINTTTLTQPVYKITTDKGIVNSSDTHLWVSRKPLPPSGQTSKGQGWQWIKTNNLQIDMEIAFTTEPWEAERTFEFGWLSGILDGEGHLGKGGKRRGVAMSVCQNEGPVLEEIKNILNKYNIKYKEYKLKRNCKKLEFSKWEAFKLLGLTQPIRLMKRVQSNVENVKLNSNNTAKILSIEYLGAQQVIALETSTKTLIANGFLSHNCVAYKRRYLKHENWNYQYVIDPTAKRLIESGVNPELIEDAYSLAEDVERRVAFQAWVQQYVDHAISSTINLPAWGSESNNENTVQKFGDMLIKYLPKLRGMTVYPDGARGGQPLTPVSLKTAMEHTGEVFLEQADLCDLTKGGSCGS